MQGPCPVLLSLHLLQQAEGAFPSDPVPRDFVPASESSRVSGDRGWLGPRLPLLPLGLCPHLLSLASSPH